MKFMRIIPLAVLILQWSLSLTAQQNDPAATALLKKITSQVETAQNVHYRFELGIDPPEEEAYTMAGEHFQAQEMFYLDLPQFRIVTNGISQWVVDKRGKEIQIHDYVEPELDQLTDPKNILTIHNNPNFRHRLIEENLIEFIPVQRDFEYFRATMQVKADEIQSIQVWAKDGYSYLLSITEQKFDVDLTQDQFVLDPTDYPEHHVEDLRID